MYHTVTFSQYIHVLSYTPITRRIEFNILSLNLKNQISLLFCEPNPVSSIAWPFLLPIRHKKKLKESEEKFEENVQIFQPF